MANILLIDHGSRHTRILAERFRPHSVERVAYLGLGPAHIQAADIIVLSGGHPRIWQHHWFFRPQYRLIAQVDKPVIGICLGFELIARTYQGKLLRLPRKVHGLRDIELEPGVLGRRVQRASVWEAHKWVLREPPADLMPLGWSRYGVELMRHRTRPVWASQFHPEVATPTNTGPQLLDWMLAQALAFRSYS